MCTLLLKYFSLFNAWKGKIRDITFFKTAFGKSNSQNCTSRLASTQKVCCPLSQHLFDVRKLMKSYQVALCACAECFIQRILRVSFSFLITGLMLCKSFFWLAAIPVLLDQTKSPLQILVLLPSNSYCMIPTCFSGWCYASNVHSFLYIMWDFCWTASFLYQKMANTLSWIRGALLLLFFLPMNLFFKCGWIIITENKFQLWKLEVCYFCRREKGFNIYVCFTDIVCVCVCVCRYT